MGSDHTWQISKGIASTSVFYPYEVLDIHIWQKRDNDAFTIANFCHDQYFSSLSLGYSDSGSTSWYGCRNYYSSSPSIYILFYRNQNVFFANLFLSSSLSSALLLSDESRHRQIWLFVLAISTIVAMYTHYFGIGV